MHEWYGTGTSSADLVGAEVDTQRRDLLCSAKTTHFLARNELLAGLLGIALPPFSATLTSESLTCAAMRPWRDGVSIVPGQIALHLGLCHRRR
jgi:hypothetical protein